MSVNERNTRRIANETGITRADLSGANLYQAELSDADLTGVTFLDGGERGDDT